MIPILGFEVLHAMQKVDHPKGAGDQRKYGMLSTMYTNLRRRSSVWEDVPIAHFSQSEFRIVRVSTEVFQTMQSLPSDEGSASASEGLESRGSAPKTSQCFAEVCLPALRTACSTSVNPTKVYTPSK